MDRIPALVIWRRAAAWACAFAFAGAPTAYAEKVTLPKLGGSQFAIFVPDDASESHRKCAETLAGKLGQIFPGEFDITSDGSATPAIRLKVAAGKKPDALGREAYSIRTVRGGIELEGVTELALRHAVWDLLNRLGYRQFFPGKTWEVVPKLDSFTLEVDVSESPDYANRRIWYGFGLWHHNREAYADWVEKNRMGGGFVLNTGHAYGGLIRSQQKAFDAHPEYYALVGGERRVNPESKMCISNPGVRAAAVAYALDYFSRNPDADSVSVDPSDGGNWCECEGCAQMGTPSDLATVLANAVAEAVAEKVGPDRRVGMYAYNYHSEPPAVAVHPNVVVSAATGFIKGGLTIDAILDGWSAKGAVTGIREYYSVSTWDRDMPGAARGSRMDYLAKTVPDFHSKGARFFSAESSDNWGANGLGYYFASRMMWDVGEAGRREAIVEDFLDRAFGPAKAPMRDFYARIDGDNTKAGLVFEDLLARMFRSLGEAWRIAADDPEVRARIGDLILYTRHAELYDRYRNASGPARQAAFEAMVRHAYRIRGTFMVHSYALYRDVARRDKTVSIPENAHWQKPAPDNPWKIEVPYSEDEIGEILAGGIAGHTPVELDFEPVAFDDSALVPAKGRMAVPDLPPGSAESGRGERSWFTVVEKVPAEIVLHVTGGLIEHYRNRGNVKIGLWKIGGASATGESQTLVAEDASVPPDGVVRTVKFAAEEPGVYRIDLDDGNDLTRVAWPEGQPMGWKMALDGRPEMLSGRWSLYFWVPEGTGKIGLYSAASAGSLHGPDGAEVLELAAKGGGFLSLEVPAGAGGNYWKFENVSGRISLMTVPPYLARSPVEMVLPDS